MSLLVAPPDLTSCDKEPIHTPGSIQPHGMMLVVQPETLQVCHAAGDVERRLEVADWQGSSLEELVGSVICSEISSVGRGPASGYMGQIVARTDEVLDIAAHLSGAYVIVELEPAPPTNMPASRILDRVAAAAAAFEDAASVVALCDKACAAFRRLTGFDRVMVYRFLEDGSGRVLAEDRRDDLHSFLNHHFPAVDIPRQARALYLRNVLRVIPDASYKPAPLRPSWTAPVALDMSDCVLRNVSPTHLLYLGNMGVLASASFSIIIDGVLWGLIACHNDSPRGLTYDVRAECRSLLGSLGRQIRAKDEAEGYRQRIRIRGFEDDIVALLAREGALDEILSRNLDKIGRMMNGNGVAILRGRELATHDICPDDDDIRDLAAWLTARSVEPVFSSDRLSTVYPPALGFQQLSSGLLAITLSSDQPWLLFWFRVEEIETINWAGNPHKGVAPDPKEPLTPRASFAAWAESVRGRSRSWSLPELDAAARLRASLLEIQQNHRVLELNRQLTKILQDKDSLLQQKEFLIGEVNHRVQNSLTCAFRSIVITDSV